MEGKNEIKIQILPKTVAGKLVMLFFIIYFAMVNPPIIALANTIHPTIFGIPFLVAWVLIWWLLAGIVAIIAAWKVWR